MAADSDPQHPRLVAAAGRALSAMHAGEDSVAVQHLSSAVEQAPEGRAAASALMMLLFHECSAMVSELGAGGTAPVKMQVFDDDGREMSIDDADPPVRTAVRTLLAEVHGDTEAARDQIDIALRNADHAEMATLMVQALRWTLKLALECTSRSLPVPEWITTALA